jgi:hypothetical protein
MPDGIEGSGNPPADTLETLPAWAQKEIRDLRNEAAAKRTRVTALEGELASERSTWMTKETTFSQQVADKSLELARYRAAVASNVPADRIDDFASRLRGSTPEELVSDAASLAQMFGTNNSGNVAPPVENNHGVDPSQGRGNGSDNTPITPATEFANTIQDMLGN